MILESLIGYRGWKLTSYYRECRKACAPPMTMLGSLEIGKLWYYGGPGADVMYCIGGRSLIAAYDVAGPRDQAVSRFQSAHAWLNGETSGPPEDLHVVFAAKELSLWRLHVALYLPGDWCGVASQVRLRPLERVWPVD